MGYVRSILEAKKEKARGGLLSGPKRFWRNMSPGERRQFIAGLAISGASGMMAPGLASIGRLGGTYLTARPVLTSLIRARRRRKGAPQNR